MELSEAAKEARRQYRRERYAKDPQKYRDQNKKWREANRERVRECNRAAEKRFWERKAIEAVQNAVTDTV